MNEFGAGAPSGRDPDARTANVALCESRRDSCTESSELNTTLAHAQNRKRCNGERTLYAWLALRLALLSKGEARVGLLLRIVMGSSIVLKLEMETIDETSDPSLEVVEVDLARWWA